MRTQFDNQMLVCFVCCISRLGAFAVMRERESNRHPRLMILFRRSEPRTRACFKRDSATEVITGGGQAVKVSLLIADILDRRVLFFFESFDNLVR